MSDGAPRYQPDRPGAEMGLGSADRAARDPHATGDDMGNASGWLLLAAAILFVAVVAGVFWGAVGDGEVTTPQSQQAVIPIEEKQNQP